MGYKISVDVGGTFTDFTIADKDTLLGRHKSPTTPKDLTQGIFNCLKLAGDGLQISVEDLLSNTDVFIHGSTTATNAVLEGKGVKCGVICTKGTKYTLWKGEGRRLDLFNVKQPAPSPLIRPYLCLEVNERINSEGEIIVSLDEEEVRAAVREFKKMNVKAIAVCLLWSILNPVHEKRVGEIIKEEWPEVAYSISSEIQPVIREYHRMSCVVLNCMVQPIVTEYLGKLKQMLAESGFKGDPLIVVSSGGLVPIGEVMEKPVFMLFSGPSMAPVAGKYYSEHHELQNCIIMDMGGTSFDVSTVINGQMTTTRNGRIRNYPTGVSATEILTLGSGGGSIARVDAGVLNVGPESAGAMPGPVCYMRGGTEPTVTDACALLGYIIPDCFLGGRMEISIDSARKTIKENIADPLKLSVEQAAIGIYQVACEKMVGGILDMTVRRGIDPREFVIVSGGGATGLFAANLAREIGVKQVIIPKETSVLCAFGGLNADVALNIMGNKYSDSSKFDYEGTNKVLEEIGEKGKAFLDRLDTPSEKRKLEYFCGARYPLQVTELEIALRDNKINPDGLDHLVEDFHNAHKARYKTADYGSPVEFVMWRHVAGSSTSKIKLRKQSLGKEDSSVVLMGTQLVYEENKKDYEEIPYYDGEKLTYGMKIKGPAIIVLTDTTIVLPRDFKISIQERGYYIMEVPV